MRETFAYAGGTRDPFASLINKDKSGPEIGDLDLVGVYHGSPHADEQRRRAAGEGLRGKRHKMRVGDQLGRSRLVQIRARDAVFMIAGLRVRAPGNSLAAQAGGRDAMTGMYRWMLVAAAVFGTATPMRAEGPGSGEVTAVSLAPAAGKTEIVVAVKGAVDVRDFLLTSPDRLVLDVVGATLGGDHREPLRRREAGRGAQPPLLAVPPGRRPDRRGPRRRRRPTRWTARPTPSA